MQCQEGRASQPLISAAAVFVQGSLSGCAKLIARAMGCPREPACQGKTWQDRHQALQR